MPAEHTGFHFGCPQGAEVVGSLEGGRQNVATHSLGGHTNKLQAKMIANRTCARSPAGCDVAMTARGHGVVFSRGCCRASARDVSSSSTWAIWTRPTPDRNEDWVKPSYVPKPVEPTITPSRREDQPLYAPGIPEFKPAELPEQAKELPAGPKMPDRPRDPIPAGNPKKEAPPGEADKREAPPSEKK